MVEIGEKAPQFMTKALINNEEQDISLNDFKGKRIALYFYPKDMTQGCMVQAENLRDNYDELKNNNIQVIGVSKDSIRTHRDFAKKKNLPFPLIADEDLKVNNLYGVWILKKFMGKEFMGTQRTTFLIDEDQIIVGILDKPVVKSHAEEILEAFGKE